MTKVKGVTDFKGAGLLDAKTAQDFTGRLFDRDIIGKDAIFIGARQLPDTKFKNQVQKNFVITALVDGESPVEIHTRHGWGGMVHEKLTAPGAFAIRARLVYKAGKTKKDGRYYLAAPGSETDAIPQAEKTAAKKKGR